MAKDAVARATPGASRKFALLSVTLVYLPSGAKEANAACSYKSLENLPPLTRSAPMPMTIIFGHSDSSNAGEAISRFEKEMQVTRPRILEVAAKSKL